MKIEFGALAPPLYRQVFVNGVKQHRLRGFQACADGLVHLAVFGALTDAEVKLARFRLMKRMAKTFPELASPKSSLRAQEQPR